MKNLVQCLHPKFIRNPHMELPLMQSRMFLTPDGEQYVSNEAYIKLKTGYHPYNPFQMRVTLENIDQFQVVCEDGTLIPMFMAVPCRHCLLCKDKSANQWAYRAMCETQFSKNVPYFLTLTYDNGSLPLTEDGLPTLRKKDYQDFMKRLRIHLQRNGKHFGLTQEQCDKLDIRYIFVGEYGKKNNRPHYHAIVWNLPPMINIAFMNAYVKARWIHGIVRVLPVTNGGVNYVLKYMRKPSQKLHYTQEPVFFEASRRPGIGSAWLDCFREWCLNNAGHPATCYDQFNGVSMTCQIPDYMKNKLFPTFSRMVNSRCSKYLKAYNLLASYLGQCLRENSMLMPLEAKRLTANFDVELVNKKYPDYAWLDYHFPNLFAFDIVAAFRELETETYTFLISDIPSAISAFIRIQDWLLNYDSPSHELVLATYQKNLERKIVVENYLRDLPEVDLMEKAYSIDKKVLKLLDREKI